MKFIKSKERKITMLHFCQALTCLNVSVSHTTGDELQPTPKTLNTRSREFQKHWKVQYSWLENDEEEGMFCKLCRAYPQVADKTSTFFIGSLRAGIQYRIEPIRSHSGSKSHEACVLKSMFSSNVEQAPITRALKRKLPEEKKECLVQLFNTAYHIAYDEKPFVEFLKLCKLQTKNGTDLGLSYQNDHACKDLSQPLQNKMIKEEIKNVGSSQSSFFGLMADGGQMYQHEN